jgi:tetratricopeptide (TPR) repeat protein
LAAHDDDRANLALTLADAGDTYQMAGKSAEGERRCREALYIADKLVAENPRNGNGHIARALGLLNLAGIQLETKRYDEASRSAKDAADEFRALTNSPFNRARNLLLLYMAHETWGEALRRSGHPEPAEDQFRRVMRASEALLQDLEKQSAFGQVPANALTPNITFTRSKAEVELGTALTADKNRRSEASTRFDHAIAELSRLAREFPRIPKYHTVLASAFRGRAALRAQMGQTQLAAEDRTEADKHSKLASPR